MQRSQAQLRRVLPLAFGILTLGGVHASTPQEPPGLAVDAPEVDRVLRVEPSELSLDVGDTAQLTARVESSEGEPLEAELLYFSRARRSVAVDSEGLVTALQPGDFTIVVRERRRQSAGGENQASRESLGPRLTATVPVTVRRPELARVELRAPEGGVFVGTTIRIAADGRDAKDRARTIDAPTWRSSHPNIASFDAFGELHVHAPGGFTVSAMVEGTTTELALTAGANPIAKLSLTPDRSEARTGDVVLLGVDAHDADGAAVQKVPIDVTFRARPDDPLGPAATGQIEPIPGTEQAWRFVAEQPGLYTFVASSGDVATRASVRIDTRDVAGKFEFVGHGPVPDTHTSDLWVWEGADGRDYCVTGTWGAEGDAHFWDVTDPTQIERIATIRVDARTVNDVKVSPDGRICVLSREGASNRRNGMVLVDVSNPHEPEIISTFDDELTGGVHNTFIDGDHVYALSAGRRYDVIEVSDPGSPRRVGSYKVEGPRSSIHDVWVADGLAYSSNWSDGVHIVDVGNGIKGGSPDNPGQGRELCVPERLEPRCLPVPPKGDGHLLRRRRRRGRHCAPRCRRRGRYADAGSRRPETGGRHRPATRRRRARRAASALRESARGSIVRADRTWLPPGCDPPIRLRRHDSRRMRGGSRRRGSRGQPLPPPRALGPASGGGRAPSSRPLSVFLSRIRPDEL